jgi:DNA-binding response OmpR family regulator
MTSADEEVLSILHQSKETILLLASEPAISRVICKTLEANAYCVLKANDLGSASDWLKECEPHLLIVRQYTENVSGHEAAVYLRSLQPGLPVLILGGVLDDPELEAREAVLEFEVFPKPYSAAELIVKVKEMLLRYPGRRAGSGVEQVRER